MVMCPPAGRSRGECLSGDVRYVGNSVEKLRYRLIAGYLATQ
jgi:hypothetical protein